MLRDSITLGDLRRLLLTTPKHARGTGGWLGAKDYRYAEARSQMACDFLGEDKRAGRSTSPAYGTVRQIGLTPLVLDIATLRASVDCTQLPSGTKPYGLHRTKDAEFGPHTTEALAQGPL